VGEVHNNRLASRLLYGGFGLPLGLLPPPTPNPGAIQLQGSRTHQNRTHRDCEAEPPQTRAYPPPKVEPINASMNRNCRSYAAQPAAAKPGVMNRARGVLSRFRPAHSTNSAWHSSERKPRVRSKLCRTWWPSGWMRTSSCLHPRGSRNTRASRRFSSGLPALRALSVAQSCWVGANACPVSLGGIDEVRLDCSARLIPWPNMDSWIGLDTHGHNSHPVALLHLQESPAIPTKT